MSRSGSFIALLALFALSFAGHMVHGARLAIQPPAELASDSETRPEVRSALGAIDPQGYGVGPYECPSGGSSLSEASVLIQCSAHQDGKLQCVYGDLTSSSKAYNVLGGLASSTGLGKLPSTDICAYDTVRSVRLLPSQLFQLQLSNASYGVTFTKPFHIRLLVSSPPRRRPSANHTPPFATLRARSLLLSLSIERRTAPNRDIISHRIPTPSPSQLTSS